MKASPLVSSAALVWAAVLAVTLSRALAPGLAVLLIGAMLALWRPWEAIAASSLAGAGAVGTWLRVRALDRMDFSDLHAVVSRPPQPSPNGWSMTVRLPGLADLRVFTSVDPGLRAGQTIHISGEAWSASGLAGHAVQATNIEVLGEPGFAGSIKAHVSEVISHNVDGPAAGLLPAMTLGDTSMQQPPDQAAYVATGLTHLSAVSGGNVAMLTTAVAVVATMAGLRPPWRIGLSLLALAGFVFVVGQDDASVLRAACMGSVSLVALLAKGAVSSIHAVCLAIVAVLFFDPGFASSFGFALSVAATIGIVVLSPLLDQTLASPRIPRVITKAVAIAIAADLSTLPVVALMAHRVSLLSVLANVLVAPVVPVITVLGLAGVVLSWCPLGGWLFAMLAPLAQWIATVAHAGAAMSNAMVELPAGWRGVAWAGLAAGWAWWCWSTRRWWIPVGAMLVVCFPRPTSPVVDTSTLRTAVVANEDDPVPEDTQLIVVTSPGRPHERPSVTPGGAPVVYPNRDGPVTLYEDGTQRAHDRHF